MKKMYKIIIIISVLSAVGGCIASFLDVINRRKLERRSVKKGIYYHKTKGLYERYFKRFFDFFLSNMALIVLSPILIITSILVRINLGSPVIFVQRRPGKEGKVFSIFKYRTMTDGRDETGNLLSDKERLTSFGKTLRSTSIDELPELINILRGDMSIIGPRPLLVDYLDLYSDEQKHRHDVKPGLTGLAQVSGRNSISWADRFVLDVEYVNNITFVQDLKILILTIKSVIMHEGISSPTSDTMEDFDGTN